MTAPAFEATAGHYAIRWGEPDYLTIEADLLRAERSGEVTAEVTVWATPEGLAHHLHTARLNLSSTRSRAELARYLRARSNGHQPDFEGAIEYASAVILREFRAGAPAIRLRDAERPPDAGHILPPLALGRMPTILFGDGGVGKSLLALAAGLSIETGVPLLGLTPTTTARVGYLDWEMDAWEHRERALALTGDESDLTHIPCARPLSEDVERIRRIVRQRSLGYLIVDSVGLACDGPPEAADVANRFFVALRAIGLGALCIAHTTKGENADAKPFGSAFWHNGARLTWLVRKQQEIGGALTVGLFNKKANTGPAAAPLGFAIEFGDRVTIRRTDVRDIPDLAEHVPLRYRIEHELAAGARTVAEIAAALDVSVDSVKKALGRHEGVAFVRTAGADGIYRWGLRYAS